MNDPKIQKSLALIKAEVKFSEADKVITLCRLIDKDIAQNNPSEVLESKLKEDIGKISIKSGTELYGMSTSYSYVDEEYVKEFDFGNVLVQVHLPYCLNIPDHYEMKISVPEDSIEALVTAEKIWTSRSKTEDGESDNVDFFAEDRPLFLNKSTILSPKLPFRPEEGWDSYVTGRNIEIVKDKNGVFRYSKLHIQLNLDLPKNIEGLRDKSREKLLKSVQDISLQIVNRLIDNYRDVTEEVHIRKLSWLKTNLIYFLSQNIGFYVLTLNVRTAMINRSLDEIEKIKNLVVSGKRPELYRTLLLNAKDSFESKDFTLAIVESFQALEIFLENYLISAFQNRGDSQVNYEKTLKKYWETKKRLNTVLKDLKGTTLNSQDALWDKWCLRYDKTRNEVIHAAKEPTKKETEETLDVNEKVINWLRSL